VSRGFHLDREEPQRAVVSVDLLRLRQGVRWLEHDLRVEPLLNESPE